MNVSGRTRHWSSPRRYSARIQAKCLATIRCAYRWTARDRMTEDEFRERFAFNQQRGQRTRVADDGVVGYAAYLDGSVIVLDAGDEIALADARLVGDPPEGPACSESAPYLSGPSFEHRSAGLCKFFAYDVAQPDEPWFFRGQ